MDFTPNLNPSRRRRDRLLLLLLWVIALAPAVVPLRMIVVDGVDCPIEDQYDPEILDVSLAASHGHLSPLLFAQHNEHRVLIPKLIYLTLDPLTHGNTKSQMLVEWVVVVGTSLVILALLHRTVGGGEVAIALQWLACNVLLFSPVQLENWLWGIGLMNVLPAAFIAAMLLALLRDPLSPASVGVAAGCAMAASFSSGNGLLAWFLGLTLLRVAEPQRRRRSYVLAWALASGLAAVLFVHGYHRRPPLTGIPVDFSARCRYVLAFLGSPFASVVHLRGAVLIDWAETLGAALVALVGALAWRWTRTTRRGGDLGGFLVWVSLAGFAVLSGVMAAATRAQLGTEQALTSRYSSFALYLPVALIGMAGMIARRVSAAERRDWAAGVIALVVFSAAAYPEALRRSAVMHELRLQAKAALLLTKVLPDNPQIATLLDPDVPLFLRQAPKLDAAGWIRPPMVTSADAKQLQLTPPPPPASVGQLERFYRISESVDGATGWALRPGRHDAADAVLITARVGTGPDEIIAMGRMGIYRDDVAARFGADSLISGWDAAISASKLDPLRAEHRGPVWLQAWSFDVHSGRAALLGGAVLLGS